MRSGDHLQPTTWDAYLHALGTRLRSIIDRDGPEAIGVFFGGSVGMDAAGTRRPRPCATRSAHRPGLAP
jgi:hypothetical protein